MKRLAFAAALAAALLAACGGGGGDTATPTPTPTPPPVESGQTPPPASCSLSDQKTWLAAYMRDRYFWFDRMGTPNAGAADIDSYLTSLLYSPVDRYSYTQPASTFTQYYAEGTRLGYGYSLVFTDSQATTIRVRAVEPASPVAQAGMRRGDYVLSIDGRTPSQIATDGLPAVSTEGVPRTFVLRDAAGAQRTITVSSAVFVLAPVLANSVLDVATPNGNRRVAYMAYQEFISAGNLAMGEAFAHFASEGATELVLDLRYNGGGEVGIARNLSSMIGGNRLAGQTFTQLRFNTRHPEDNLTIPFTSDARVLPGPPMQGLQRVFVIAASGTASASELVINSLKPFMEVVLIGATTYGKPYGFEPVQACGTVFNAVNFDSVNALGVGGYNNGLSPTCAVPDDLDHALGDPSERRLAAALYYAGRGSCPATATALSQDILGSKAGKAITEGAPPGMRR